uniref:Uncharacterized protein n=1 Tax=Plectus sambesii TaxID=2011161 RepID=A0A914W760_9BILA
MVMRDKMEHVDTTEQHCFKMGAINRTLSAWLHGNPSGRRARSVSISLFLSVVIGRWTGSHKGGSGHDSDSTCSDAAALVAGASTPGTLQRCCVWAPE